MWRGVGDTTRRKQNRERDPVTLDRICGEGATGDSLITLETVCRRDKPTKHRQGFVKMVGLKMFLTVFILLVPFMKYLYIQHSCQNKKKF